MQNRDLCGKNINLQSCKLAGLVPHTLSSVLPHLFTVIGVLQEQDKICSHDVDCLFQSHVCHGTFKKQQKKPN